MIGTPVNLAVDSMSTPLTSTGDLRAALKDHSREYRRAATLVGLSPADWSEVKERVSSDDIDGPSILPHRFTAMAGDHRGSVYVVRNAETSQAVYGYIVRLRDHKTVVFLSRCGNLSVVAPMRRAVAVIPSRRSKRAVAPVAYVPAPAPVTPVIVAPAPAEAPIAASAPAAESGPVARGGIGALPLFAIGAAALGGIVYGFQPHGGSSPTAPGCAHGSNLLNACQK